ncbi:hypothetical protein [Caldicellulosiruptor morganii]|uniref:Uncharacterized protein n=1 Tax=Caldicellulosiruptor morganii TaxID=1387555 RepID=A0ABY7BR27_9FIRM|nr:hypothetical protein [Caldicellulosiruptor morganii]WAM33909.1 hypothetical protein OTK00_000049 [Caldicellulosiruptor morganii]
MIIRKIVNGYQLEKIVEIPESAKNVPVEVIVRIPFNKRKKSKKSDDIIDELSGVFAKYKNPIFIPREEEEAWKNNVREIYEKEQEENSKTN